MNDEHDGPRDADPEATPARSEPVGSVGEEAAKLLGALSEWARDQGTDYAGSGRGCRELVRATPPTTSTSTSRPAARTAATARCAR